jgi:hypothetical protein
VAFVSFVTHETTTAARPAIFILINDVARPWNTPWHYAGAAERPSTDGNGDESQKLVVGHRLFQYRHHPKAGGLAFDLEVVDAGDQ